MTQHILPPPNMPHRFDEGRVERAGAHAYDIGRSFDAHAYGAETRLAYAFKRGWFARKREIERDASNA